MIILKVPSQASSITTEGNEDVGFQDRLRNTLDCHRFHEAFHEYLNILPKLQEIPEGAAGNEESLLLAVTAAHGQSAWCKILKDAKIPSDLKMDLITTIHENSTILETTPYTDIIKKEQNSRNEEDFAQ